MINLTNQDKRDLWQNISVVIWREGGGDGYSEHRHRVAREMEERLLEGVCDKLQRKCGF